VKIQLRKPARCDADAVDKAEGCIRRPILRDRAGVAGSPARGSFQRDSPGTQESSPSPFARKVTSRRGKPEAPGTDG
jgi:hypothetical protein